MLPLFFSKGTIPIITNSNLLFAIQKVHDAGNQESAIKVAYSIITSKFNGHRFYTYFLLWRAFETDPNILWKRSGFLHCTQQNYLLFVLLIKSGWYTDKDIQLGYSLVWFVSPHQYLRVRCQNRILYVDPWNFAFGAPFGTYASGFGHTI